MSIAFFLYVSCLFLSIVSSNIVSLQGGEDRIQKTEGEGEGVQQERRQVLQQHAGENA